MKLAGLQANVDANMSNCSYENKQFPSNHSKTFTGSHRDNRTGVRKFGPSVKLVKPGSVCQVQRLQLGWTPA